MGLTPALDQRQGLPPDNQFDRFERTRSQEPTEADSRTREPYVPSATDAAQQVTSSARAALLNPADFGRSPAELDNQQAVEAYERRAVAERQRAGPISLTAWEQERRPPTTEPTQHQPVRSSTPPPPAPKPAMELTEDEQWLIATRRDLAAHPVDWDKVKP